MTPLQVSLSLVVGSISFLTADVSASAQQICHGDWVLVDSGCELPNDLAIGDSIEITVGSAVNTRGTITGWQNCGGHRTYYISPVQKGCGWRDAVTAYSRSQESTLQAARTDADLRSIESEALQVPAVREP